MAIGDACLADPAHHHEKEAKAHVVSNYRRSMLWRYLTTIASFDASNT